MVVPFVLLVTLALPDAILVVVLVVVDVLPVVVLPVSVAEEDRGLFIKKIPKNFLWCGTNCPLIITDGQDAHPTKLGNLFFGDP